MEKVYTLQEVAGLLKVSVRTVQRYIKSRKLNAVKIGQWRISESALSEFLNNPKLKDVKANKK